MSARVAAGLLVLASLVSPVQAHLGHVVLRAERYLKLDAEPEGVRVVVSLTLGPNETVRIAQAADANGDGEITSAEADAYMSEWGEGLLTELPVQLDGEPIEPLWGESFFDPLGPIQPVSGAVEMVAHIPLDPGRHAVSIRDRMRVEAFDRTDVAFEGQPGTTTVFSGAGPAPTGYVQHLAYGPDNAPEMVTLIVDQRGLPNWVWPAAGAGATVGIVLLLVFARLRKTQ